MFVLEIVLFIAGIVFLIVGANLLVSGASGLALRLGISSAVIGLTVVAFGTGAPELGVGIEAALKNRPEIALGNVIGSNIVNLLVVLAIAALVAPVSVSKQLIRKDAPAMVAVSLILLVMALDGSIGRGEGIILLVLFVLYTVWALKRGRRQTELERETRAELQEEAGQRRSVPMSLLLLVGGLGLLFQGSLWVVEGAVSLARYLGMSELLVGLTIVAISTSLPEIATTVAAGLRKQPDLGVGNVVGSNIFNILVVLGLAAVLTEGGLTVPEESIRVDIPVMAAAALACVPIFWTGYVISRLEGLFFLASYGCYTVYVVLNGMESGLLPLFKTVITRVVMPITAVVVLLLFVLTWLRSRRNRT